MASWPGPIRPRSWGVCRLTFVAIVLLVVLSGCSGLDGGDGTGEDTIETDDAVDRPPVEDRLRSGDDRVQPGMFTELDDGFLVGAHPYAVDDSVRVEVSQFDPSTADAGTDPDAYAFHEPNVRQRGPFVEIAALDTEQPIESEPHTEFYVAIPVPAEIDEEHLALLSYSADRVDFPPGAERDNDSTRPPVWEWTPGTYDSEFDVYVVQIDRIGTPENPTRLGLVEHAERPTIQEWERAFQQPGIRTLSTQYFPRVEDEPWPPEDTLPRPIENGSHVYQSGFSPTDSNFYINCVAAGCNQSVVDEHRNVLDHAGSTFHTNLDGSPNPDLETEKIQVVTDSGSTTEEFYVYNVVDTSTHDNCIDDPGWYTKEYIKFVDISLKPGSGYTCLRWSSSGVPNNDPVETTTHELVHSMQHDYYTVGYKSDDIIVESTANLGMDWQNPDEATNTHPNDLPDLSGRMRDGAYAWEHFYAHLLASDGSLDFADLGNLYDEQLEWAGLEDWLGWGEVRRAYWDFVTDAVYEHDHSTVDDPVTGAAPDQCDVDPFEFSSTNDFAHEIDVHAAVGPSSGDPVHPDGTVEWRIDDPGELSSHVVAVDLPAVGYDPYRATIEVEIWGEDDLRHSNWLVYTYDDIASEYEGCSSDIDDSLDAWDAGADAAIFEIPVYQRPKTVYVVHSNMDPDEDTFDPTVTFEPLDESEIPTPAADNHTVEFPAYPDDHSGEITVDLPVSSPDGDDDPLDVSPSSGTTDAANEVRTDDDLALTYELDEEYESSPDAITNGRYEDDVTYHVTNDRYMLRESGVLTVERDLNPIARQVNYSLDWGLEEIDPLTPPAGPVCNLGENRDDVNPVDYPGSPFDNRDLHVGDASGADPALGTVVVNDDEQTVEYRPSTDLQGWQYDDLGSDDYQTTPGCRYVDSFVYESANELHSDDITGGTDAVVDIYDPQGEAEPPEIPTTTIDWVDVVIDTLSIRPGTDIGIGSLQGSQRAGHGLLTLQQSDRRTAYVRPASRSEWSEIGQEGRDLAITGLTDDGLAVGWTDDGTEFRAATSYRGDGLQELPASGESVALGVNDGGDVAGHARLDGEPAPMAVLWAEGQPTAIGQNLDRGSLATALNDGGQVVGIHEVTPFRDGLSEQPIDPNVGVLDSLRTDLLADDVTGFVYDYGSGGPATGESTDLGTLGGTATIPTAISDDGAVVGASTVDPNDPEAYHAFYWTDGRMVEIDRPEKAVRSTATDVNDDDYVVGTYERADGSTRGFLWHPEDGVEDLNDRIFAHDEWTVVEATAIDDEGRIQLTVQVTEDARWTMVVTMPDR